MFLGAMELSVVVGVTAVALPDAEEGELSEWGWRFRRRERLRRCALV